MITGPIIAEIAALVGDPARATIVSALLDGRALTASELAVAARITPQTASTHLAKLTEAGLLSVVRNGRHRYFRLASPTVVDMIDGIVAVDSPPLWPTVPRLDRATPTHRGSGRGRDHQALLRSRLDGEDEAQPGRTRHPSGTAGLPGDLRHRRVRTRRPRERLVAPRKDSPPARRRPRAAEASPSVKAPGGRFDRRRSVHPRVREFRM
jgi:DNA-binding transcriptional ArsR family regulator